jgi:hypothetical protein
VRKNEKSRAFTQEEKDAMPMKNAAIDKLGKKCPEGQVPDGKGGCMSKPKIVKIVKPTADSTDSYTSRMLSDMRMSFRSSGDTKKYYDLKVDKDVKDLNRQKLKGKQGYDKNGFPIKQGLKKN